MTLPDESQRLSIVGKTGTGKTLAAMWHLSLRNYMERPWIIYNWKRDKNIDGIPGHRELPLNEIPKQPGIYVVHPHPDDHEAVQDQMWEIWARENMGVYVDEGYMVGKNNPAFRSLLTQGRSKQIPMIVLSQRPVWMDRFVLSESEFYQVFRLQHYDDVKEVEKYVHADLRKKLPKYHSYYHDAVEETTTVLSAVPDLPTIYKSFDAKLSRLRQVV